MGFTPRGDKRLSSETVGAGPIKMAVMTATMPITIILADDHPVVRLGVKVMLQSVPEFRVAGEASDGLEALALLEKHQPTILLLDLAMPNMPGIETLREITSRGSTTKTILLTSSIDDRQIIEALQLGARGVLTKDAIASDLVTCIRAVQDGQYWLWDKPVVNLVQTLQSLMAKIASPNRKTFGLTSRELEIVNLIAQGCSNKDISKECDITEETVKRHLKNVFDKVGVSSRLELALFALNHKLVEV